MINQNCVIVLMRYLDEKIVYKNRGTPRIKIHNLKLDGYTTEEIYAAAKYIADCGYVDVDPGIDIKGNRINYKNSTPKHYHIRGITPKGYDFLSVVNTSSIWDKIRSNITSIESLLSVGKTALEIIQYFNRTL